MTDLYGEMASRGNEKDADALEPSDDDATPLAAALAKLAAVRRLAQANNHPGVNVGAHQLAGEILKVLNDE